MYKLNNYKRNDTFEEVEDALECAVKSVMTEDFHGDVIAMVNDIYKEQSQFVACKGGYTDTIMEDGVYTREEILELLWDFASFVYDWNSYAEKHDFPTVKEAE